MSTSAGLPSPNGSHATPEALDVFVPYFEAKSAYDVERTMSFYSPSRTSHNDATLGWTFESWDAIRGVLTEYMPKWGDGISYATEILGDERSAVLFIYDSPELFGGEVRAISAVDLEDGRFTRFVDYWDSRHFGAATAAGMRAPLDAFPQTFGDETLPSNADSAISQLVDELSDALAASQAARATELFAADAVMEDMTLRTSLRGRRAIGGHLERALDRLPYGPGTNVRRILGNELGGGFEWVNLEHPVGRGVVALAMDPQGLISRFTTVWDGALLGPDALAGLTRLALDL